jgi:hypothetical protein
MQVASTDNVFEGWVGRFLSTHLAVKTKRLVFMASLTAILKGTNHFDNETLKKMNSVMSLCDSEQAMKLPIHLSKVIWRGKNADEFLKINVAMSSTTMHELANRIIKSMPAWLRYGEDDTIEADVACIFDNRSVFA